MVEKGLVLVLVVEKGLVLVLGKCLGLVLVLEKGLVLVLEARPQLLAIQAVADPQTLLVAISRSVLNFLRTSLNLSTLN